jgi:hypothetical protein
MKRSLIVASLLVACTGGSGTGDGGTGDGGGGGEGGVGACPAAMSTVVVPAPFLGYSVSVVGSDIYYVNNPAITTYEIRHVRADGTGNEVLLSGMPSIGAAKAIDSDIYYFQNDSMTTTSTIHLYRMARTGGMGTQIGTATFPGIIALANAINPMRLGVFAKSGNDLFVGTKTIIADAPNAGIFYPYLVGTSVHYILFDGGVMKIYKTPANASAPSGTQVGTQTCGSTTALWVTAHANGFFCGAIDKVEAVDLAGTMKTTWFAGNHKGADLITYNPTPMDGTTFYAAPSVDKVTAILRMDSANQATATPVVCAQGVIDMQVGPTDLVWIEDEPGTSKARLLRSARR